MSRLRAAVEAAPIELAKQRLEFVDLFAYLLLQGVRKSAPRRKCLAAEYPRRAFFAFRWVLPSSSELKAIPQNVNARSSSVRMNSNLRAR
jgi:hypothetical protein